MPVSKFTNKTLLVGKTKLGTILMIRQNSKAHTDVIYLR